MKLLSAAWNYNYVPITLLVGFFIAKMSIAKKRGLDNLSLAILVDEFIFQIKTL